MMRRPAAVIFDMDGLLVDSEPLWKIAEKKVFGALGLALTDEMLRQVMGFRLNEVVHHWYNHQPWDNPDHAKTEAEVLSEVRSLIIGQAEAMEGVHEVLRAFQHEGIPLAIASSSSLSLIEAVTEKQNIRSYFRVLWSAEFEERGKPHPGIFLTAAQKLGADPKDCLVFEDSINGVIAAKAARMMCVAVPEEATLQDPRFAIADLKVRSLTNCLPLEGLWN